MSAESYTPSNEVFIDTETRFKLASIALDEVHRHGREQEVTVYLQQLLAEAEVEDTQAIDVPYETYRDIGLKLRDQLKAEHDQRSVMVFRDDSRRYKIKHPELQGRHTAIKSPARRNLNQLFGIR